MNINLYISNNDYMNNDAILAGSHVVFTLADRVSPRVTIDVAFLDLKNTGAAMKESIGTFRTIIQGPGSRSAVAA